ncbi:MAG: PAS domain S-box protein [Candidatus Aminicenantes bacterium]|nr:PAS domain S-box protein [Candidatus Aminicenantes bacterium]
MSSKKNDEKKTREELFRELDRLRNRVKELEAAEKERREAVEALRLSEHRCEKLVRESPDPIISLDSKGNFLSFNPAAEQVSGFSKEKVIGKHFAGIGMLDRESRSKALREFALITSGVERPPFELVFSCNNNGYRIMEANPRLIRNEDEQEWVEVTLRDLTGRRMAEEERKQLEERLRQAHKMQALGTLAGGIAHEFNNILGAIVGFTELTLDQLPENSVAEANLKRVLSASYRAAEMVKQILFFSQKEEKERSSVYLNDILEEALAGLENSVPANVEIRKNAEEGLQPILADRVQLRQVFTNLCSNAFFAMKEKGGVLDISLKEIEIDFEPVFGEESEASKYQQLIVADTGHGMDAATRGRIFEPYFTTREVGEGTGLGLAMVYGTVKSHRGKIRVYSEVGKGTKVHIFLPVKGEGE